MVGTKNNKCVPFCHLMNRVSLGGRDSGIIMTLSSHLLFLLNQSVKLFASAESITYWNLWETGSIEICTNLLGLP